MGGREATSCGHEHVDTDTTVTTAYSPHSVTLSSASDRLLVPLPSINSSPPAPTAAAGPMSLLSLASQQAHPCWLHGFTPQPHCSMTTPWRQPEPAAYQAPSPLATSALAARPLCLLLACLCLAAVRGQTPSLPFPFTIATNSSSTLLSVAGDNSSFGIFDPSLSSFPGGVAMSYSSVLGSASVHTRVAVSAEVGQSFTFVSDVNAVSAVTVGCGAGLCSGFLVHEVSSILYDDTEPDSQRLWKLLCHSYLVQEPGDVLQYPLGFISLYTAPTLSGPWNETARLGWLSSSSNFSSASASLNLNGLPGLTDCIAFTEPGATLQQQSSTAPLLLVLGCVYPQDGQPLIRQVLLGSDDHGVSFAVLNANLVPANTGLLLGFDTPQMNGGDLFSIDGLGLFLLVSPTNLTASGVVGYLGCLLFALDGNNSTLQPSAPLAWIVAADLSFSGACAFAGSATGVMADRLNRFAAVPFEIRQSGLLPAALQSQPAASSSSSSSVASSTAMANSGFASLSSSSSGGLSNATQSSSAASNSVISSSLPGTRIAATSSSSSSSNESITSGIKASASVIGAHLHFNAWLLFVLSAATLAVY